MTHASGAERGWSRAQFLQAFAGAALVGVGLESRALGHAGLPAPPEFPPNAETVMTPPPHQLPVPPRMESPLGEPRVLGVDVQGFVTGRVGPRWGRVGTVETLDGVRARLTDVFGRHFMATVPSDGARGVDIVGDGALHAGSVCYLIGPPPSGDQFTPDLLHSDLAAVCGYLVRDGDGLSILPSAPGIEDPPVGTLAVSDSLFLVTVQQDGAGYESGVSQRLRELAESTAIAPSERGGFIVDCLDGTDLIICISRSAREIVVIGGPVWSEDRLFIKGRG